MNWTAVGSDASAQKTYASVRQALADIEKRRNVEVFLQGSYANATNIRADSDVDIVVMTKRTYQGSTERLNPVGMLRYDGQPQATFSADDLRNEVIAALVAYYGASRVHPRNKCIKVDKVPGYVDADIVPCLQYQWYQVPDSIADFIEGVSLLPVSGGTIINFPKEHRKNGEQKNALCNRRYKETVRQVKRLRSRAVDEGRLRERVAPGYLLECLVYNAPPREFVADDSKRLGEVVLWLKYADKQNFVSCDEIHRLFKTDPGNYRTEVAQQIIDALWDAY